MNIQQKEQIEELKRCIEDGRTRAENNAIRILQNALNSNDADFRKEALVCAKRSSSEKLYKAIIAPLLKPISKSEFYDCDLLKIMCDDDNWDLFRRAGYSINNLFDDGELKKLLDSKNMAQIEDFLTVIRTYLCKLPRKAREAGLDIGSEVKIENLDIKDVKRYIYEIESFEHIYIDEIKRILAISKTIQNEYPQNQKIKEENDKINQFFTELETRKQNLITTQKHRQEEEWQRQEQARQRQEFSKYGVAAKRSNKDAKVCLIDETGKELTPVKYDGIGRAEDADFWVGRIDEKYVLIDNTGKEFSTFYDMVWSGRWLTELEFIQHSGYCIEDGDVFIDCTGCEHHRVSKQITGNFEYDLIPVTLNEKWGCIDKTGKKKISPIYGERLDFRKTFGDSSFATAHIGKHDVSGYYINQYGGTEFGSFSFYEHGYSGKYTTEKSIKNQKNAERKLKQEFGSIYDESIDVKGNTIYVFDNCGDVIAAERICRSSGAMYVAYKGKEEEEIKKTPFFRKFFIALWIIVTVIVAYIFLF